MWRSLAEVPSDLGRSVASVGNFDGVHLGHQHVIRRAREIATQLGVERVAAVTFDPHPMAVLRPEHAPSTLTTIEQRAHLLEAAGADALLVLPFTREVAGWSPERFVRDVLVDSLHAAAVVVGANFRFGQRASGDVATLRELGAVHGFVVDPVALDGGPQVWSSTYVRTCLAAGDVEGAEEALGRAVAVPGEVVPGDRRGRALGFPTANIDTGGLAVPADGVYAGAVRVLDVDARGSVAGWPAEEWAPAAISVGTNPTFEGARSRRVEAYLIDVGDVDLYGRRVEVVFRTRLRGMVRFDSVDDLLAAMREDVARTRSVWATRH